MMAPVPALEAHDVSVRFGAVQALDRISLAVAAGECLALVGESGSGKTTLLRCFNRLVEPDEGAIRLNGREARSVDPIVLRRHTGYVPQDGGLLPHWRVARNVALVPWLHQKPDPEALAHAALDRVGLKAGEFGDRWPADLSGGQRQRVAIARALAAEPAVILLDEPFGALDAITRGDLQETFLELRRQTTLTALLVTHDIGEAIRLGDRIGVMRAGRLEQVAVQEALTGNPATPYVRRLLHQAGVRTG